MLKVDDLYRAKYDLQDRSHGEVRSYMVAAVPRSGSTHFVLRLWATGVLGAPLEYLNDKTYHHTFRRFGAEGLEKYWKRLLRFRTSGNGVFGFKMFIDNYMQLMKRDPSFLTNIAPDHVIFFTRKDKVAQAVSYARAQQTKSWFAVAPETATPEYNFDHIRRQELSIYKQEDAWRKIMDIGGANPICIEYSEFLEDEAGTLSQIARHIGVELDKSAAIDMEPLDKQSDMLSKEWIHRYKEEKSSRGIA